MEEEKKVNKVETSILENPLNNEKIDITGDLTKMVEEVKNIESTPVEVKEEGPVEKEVPVIEPKPAAVEEVNSDAKPVEVVNTQVEPVVDNKIDTSVHDGTVITTVSSENTNVTSVNEEKKKLPINLLFVFFIIVFCVILGFVLYKFFRNEDGSYKKEFFDSMRDDESKEEDKITEDVIDTTISDDIIITPSDEVIYTFNSGKYIFNNKTIYLNSDYTFYFLIDDNGCVNGNYGSYTIDGNIIDLTSSKSYDCVSCEESSENNLNSFVFNVRSDGRISLNNEVFDYIGLEDVENPFVCNNENAN